MTEQEAMIRFDFIRCALLGGTKPEIIPNEDNVELMDIAIKALEEVTQYREIGTVVDFRGYKSRGSIEHIIATQIVLDEYRDIGTVEECRAAVEKQTAERPQEMLLSHGKGYECRECGNELSVNAFNGGYCHWCGKKLDWSKK